MSTLEEMAESAANAGGRFLDQQTPAQKNLENWRGKIDVKELKMGGKNHCVLAQLFGEDKKGFNGYRKGLEILGIDSDDAFRLGFRASEALCVAKLHQKYYQALGKAWEFIILNP